MGNDVSEDMLFIPRNLTEVARKAIEPRLKAVAPGSAQETYLKRLWERSGDKYFMRMGWMPRAHPLQLPSGRIIVPVYPGSRHATVLRPDVRPPEGRRCVNPAADVGCMIETGGGGHDG